MKDLTKDLNKLLLVDRGQGVNCLHRHSVRPSLVKHMSDSAVPCQYWQVISILEITEHTNMNRIHG